MPPKPAPYWQQGVFAVLLIVAVMGFNAWTVSSVTPREVRLFGPEQIDYSNLVMRALRSGHTYLELTPSPRLVSAENPYDPAKRPPDVVLPDVSYYKGRFYIYFGVAPVVTLFLPWRLVTGHELPAPYAALILVNGGFLALAGLWWALRRRYFPSSGATALALGFLVIGLGSFTHSVLRRTSIWEPPVAAGYFFASLALLFLYLGAHGRRLRWYPWASLAVGLAVGSRPTYVVGMAALVTPLILELRSLRAAGRPGSLTDRGLWGLAAALLAPFGTVCAALLAYNYARFGNPLEFGMHYQLTGTYEAAVKHFSAAYVGFNAFVYYLAPAQWSRYFPFIEPIRLPPAPAGYQTSEYVCGLLATTPFCLAAFLAPLALIRRDGAGRARLGGFLGSLAALYAALAFLLLFFVTSAARYMVDFVPSLMLLACIGLLSVERLAWAPRVRRPAMAVGSAAALLSVFACTMLNFQFQDILHQNNPGLYRALSHALDEPVWQIEKRTGVPFGPLEMDVRFPTGRTGRTEPLVTTGWEFYSDHLFVNYLDDHDLRIGYAHAGHPTRWSAPLPVDYAAQHHIRVEMGSLFPPRGHPFFDGWDDLQYGSVCRWLYVELDAKVALDNPQDFYDGDPSSLRIGSEPTDGHGGVFRGTLSAVHRGAYAAAESPRDPVGPIRLRLVIAPGSAMREVPLVTTGRRGMGDALIMRTLRPGFVRFYYDHWGDGLLESPEVPIGTGEDHVMDISMPSMWPPTGSASSPFNKMLHVEFDGATIAQQEVPAFPPRRGSVAIGRNGMGSGLCEESYPWAIREVRSARTGLVPPGATGSPGTWSLPMEASSFQRDVPPEGGAGANRKPTAATIVVWAWAFLAAWILGRMAGLDWLARLAGMGCSAARPLSGPGAWVWRHRAAVVVALVAALSVLVIVRRKAAYLRSVGPLHVRFMLPQGYWGRQQPLVSTGRLGTGTLVFVTYVDPRHIRLSAEIWGSLYASEPIAVDYDAPQDMVVNESGLYPLDHPVVKALGTESRDGVRSDFVVILNGRTVLFEPRTAFESTVSEVRVGSNPIGSSYAQPEFSGRILSVGRGPAAREWQLAGNEGLRLRFALDPDSGAGAQPMVSVGTAGSLGACYVRRVGGDSLIVGYRQPDGSVAESAMVPDADGQVHELEVVPGYSDRGGPRPAARIVVDGIRVSSPGGFRPYSTCDCVVGLDLDAPPGPGQFFTGTLMESDEIPPTTAVAAPTSGPTLSIIAQVPTGLTGADPLVVSGSAGAGDFVYIEYLGGGRARVGFDHWGVGGSVGPPFSLDPRRLHRIVVTTGSLAPASPALGAASPVRVKVDGIGVLDGNSAIYPHAAGQVYIGSNPIGGSTTGAAFRGHIVDTAP
jgi:hypothetical protein